MNPYKMAAREKKAAQISLTIALIVDGALPYGGNYRRAIYRIRRYGQPKRDLIARRSHGQRPPSRETWKLSCDRALEFLERRERLWGRRSS